MVIHKKTLAIVLFISLVSMNTMGCRNEGEIPPQSSSLNQKQNIDTSSNSNTNIKLPDVVPKEEAWKDLTIDSFDAVLPNQKAWIPLSITEDEKILGVVTSQDNDPFGQLILFDVRKRTYQVINSFKAPAQPIGADINEKWIVWSEALDQSFSIWKIHVYDRFNSKDRVIYESLKDSKGMGYPGPLIIPKLYENSLVFSVAIAEPKDNIPSIVVKKIDLETDKIVDIAFQGAHPVMTKDFIAWIGKDTEQPSGAIYWNKEGKIEQITHKKEVVYLAAHDNAIAWSGHQAEVDGWSVNIIENGIERRIFSTSSGNSLEFLSLSPRILAWQSREDIQVYDRKLDKVVTLEKNVSPSSVISKYNILIWTTPIPKTLEERAEVTSKKGILPHEIHFVNFSKNNLP